MEMAMVIIKQSLIMMVIITGHLIIDISANSAELSRPFTRPQRDVVLAPKFWPWCLLWGNPNTWQIQIDQKYKYMKYTNAWKIQIDGNTKTYVIMAVPFYIRVCSQSKLFSMHHEAITCTNINSEEDGDDFTLFIIFVWISLSQVEYKRRSQHSPSQTKCLHGDSFYWECSDKN